VFLLSVQLVTAQEICDNGIDDDGNGLVDLNDVAGCPCTLAQPMGSLISNGSFETQNCCPAGVSQNPYDYINCATGWTDYMSTATVDYYNPCGYFPNVVPQPVPAGSSVVGMVVHTWAGGASYEFLSQCLNSPMLAGETYELGFDLAAVRMQFGMIGTLPINFGDMDLAIFGLDTCPNFPYTFYDPVFGNEMPAQYCPTELGWTDLGHMTYSPSNSWQSVNFTFDAPFNVGAIMIGPACPIPQDYNMFGSSEPYFFFDGFTLEQVTLVISASGHPCTDNLELTAAPYDPVNNTYQWYLNGVAIVGQNAAVLPASTLGLGEGIYAARVVGPGGACAYVEEEVEVAYPEPLLSATAATGCAALNVVLNNVTDPGMSGTVLWDLGDGSSAASTSVLHTYTEAGTYDVRLTITSALGCQKDSLFEGLITVYPTPDAAFGLSATEACVNVPIDFTNTSQPNDVYNCQWSFGDGAITSDCPASHAYNAPGTYNVMLTVTNAFGCSDDTLMSQVIEVIQTPVPAFSYTVNNGCVPLEVRFQNDTPGLQDQTAFWDLGNGQTATTMDAITVYSTPGVYTVELTMTNTLGCSATRTDTDAITANGLPVVTFFVEPDSGCAPLEVQFTNTTDPGMIGGCAWTFGDGGTSNNCTSQHIYTAQGTYTVSLTVNSPAGCEGDTTLYHLVHVDPSPIANFVFGPQPTDFYNSEIMFDDRSSNDVISWSWHFPAGVPETSSETSPLIRYPNDDGGTYPVELTVTNEFGCSDTYVVPVTINGVHSVYAPNAFTPDGDAINDVFLPIIRDDVSRDHDLRIFDRWGSEVFQSSDPTIGWDGAVDDAEPKTDVYVWKLRSRNGVDGIMRVYTGHVTLLR